MGKLKRYLLTFFVVLKETELLSTILSIWVRGWGRWGICGHDLNLFSVLLTPWACTAVTLVSLDGNAAAIFICHGHFSSLPSKLATTWKWQLAIGLLNTFVWFQSCEKYGQKRFITSLRNYHWGANKNHTCRMSTHSLRSRMLRSHSWRRGAGRWLWEPGWVDRPRVMNSSSSQMWWGWRADHVEVRVWRCRGTRVSSTVTPGRTSRGNLCHGIASAQESKSHFKIWINKKCLWCMWKSLYRQTLESIM